MKVRKRPVEVEAMYFDGTNTVEIVQWAGKKNIHHYGKDSAGEFLTIDTLEGQMVARPTWWIVKGLAGECHPVRNDIFRMTYADYQLERSVEERLTDLMTDLAKIHKPIDEDIRECTEDVENWPCPTIKAVWRAQA